MRGPGARGGVRVLLSRAALTAALTATLAAALAGCGSGGSAKETHATPSVRVTVEQPAASTPGIGPDGTAETATASPSAPAPSAPTVPKAQLSPATGTFTARQRDYLVGKVPKGMDPAAILDTGQEACDRIATTADASAKLARQAIRGGEIADARDAIRYLCPKYTYLLD